MGVAMRVFNYVLGMIETNCYLIVNELSNQVIIVDPAEQAVRIQEKITEKQLDPVAILLTHGHFDHIMAATDLAREYDIPIYASEAEVELLQSPKLNLSVTVNHNYALTPDVEIKDNDSLELANMKIKVLHTPGHTAGGVCYYFPESEVLFSGDTLFSESVGRTDLPTGNSEVLLESIRTKLIVLSDDVKVYPGHGPSTTIAHEKTHNPYLYDENFWD